MVVNLYPVFAARQLPGMTMQTAPQFARREHHVRRREPSRQWLERPLSFPDDLLTENSAGKCCVVWRSLKISRYDATIH